MIFGHRGLSSLAPENTMAAFRCAVDHQVKWVEADVDVITDGTVIICHDSTLDRTTNRTGRYDDLTAAALAGAAARGWGTAAGCDVIGAWHVADPSAPTGRGTSL